MQIKVVTLNEDGSVAFEGLFGPNEVKFVLEVGTNFLLANGASPYVEEDEEESEEDVITWPEDDTSPTLQ
jgi:hypothetical protein